MVHSVAALITLLLVVVAVRGQANQTNLTYGELGATIVLPNWNASVGLLPLLNSTSQPDSVKPMRKSLLYARNGLDIFVYAFPVVAPWNAKAQELFELVRGDLNNGYTLVGNFQDLQGVHYTHKDYEKRLKPCLEWKAQFEANIKKYNYGKFVQSISPNVLFHRSKSGMSKDYWRHVSGTPVENLTGLQNIAMLASGQLHDAGTDYHAMIKLEEIWKTTYHEQFHNYRKLLRAIYYVGTTFPAIYSSSPSTGLDLVNSAYGTFGDINDEVADYSFYKEKGDKKKEEEKLKSIIKDWAAFKVWLKKKDFPATLQHLTGALIHFSP